MIAALRGDLERWDPERSALWIAVTGVTYEVVLPAFAADWAASHAPGEELRVYTYYHATERQPTPTLYGFPHLAERDFFRKFIEVPDVGPAKAVRALTRPVSEIARWVENEDTKALTQLPGIGPRLASTIVAHLHGRLVQEALLRDATGPRPPEAPDLRADAADALVALQYTRREAEQLVGNALSEHPELDDLESVLRHVLSEQAPAGAAR